MKVIEYNNQWPDSYKMSYYYDLMEVYGKAPRNMLGYVYQYKFRKQSIIDLIKQKLPKGATILDVAAAQGNFSLSLAELGYEVTWNDLRTELVDYVQLKYDHGIVHFKPGNVFDLDSSIKYDAVLITEIIEHVAHPDEFLLKISKMIKPEGYIFMSTPNGAYFLNKLPKFTTHNNPAIFEAKQFKPNSDGHIFLIYPEELKWFCEKLKLDIIELELYSNFLTNGHFKTSLLLRILPKIFIEWLEKNIRKLPFSRKLHSGMTVVFKKRY